MIVEASNKNFHADSLGLHLKMDLCRICELVYPIRLYTPSFIYIQLCCLTGACLYTNRLVLHNISWGSYMVCHSLKLTDGVCTIHCITNASK